MLAMWLMTALGRVILTVRRSLLVFPNNRTSSVPVGMSQKYQ
jgi:hypothetical protein